jgi:pilus assembly protein Flp/PilA
MQPNRLIIFAHPHWVISIARSHAMTKLVSHFLKDVSGATAIEYGLIAAGISIAIIAVVNGLGTTLNEKFTAISTQLK